MVLQPTCAYVLKQEYPDFLGTDDARLVAEHTFDVSEYLMARPDQFGNDGGPDEARGSGYKNSHLLILLILAIRDRRAVVAIKG